jgi:hypothetical protein
MIGGSVRNPVLDNVHPREEIQHLNCRFSDRHRPMTSFGSDHPTVCLSILDHGKALMRWHTLEMAPPAQLSENGFIP